jgi:type IV pilus assembly protein PilC
MNQSRVRISAKERMQLFGNLSTMLKAGIPILESVEALLEETKGGTQKVLETIQADLQAGRVVHESLAQFPESFNQVTVNLLKAAEEAGTLEVALKDVQNGLQKETEFADKLKSSLMYPAFVLILFVGMMIVMLTMVIPRMSQVFRRMNMDLPLPTRIMFAASDGFLKNYLIIIGLVIAVAAAIGAFYHYQRKAVLNVLCSLPLISGLMREIDLTRFTRNMSLLLGSGLPIVKSLELAEDTIVKKDLRMLIISAREKIMGGEKLSTGLRTEKKLISGIIIKLIEIGERTGTLDQSMKDVALMMDYEVTNKLQKTTALLEPIMLVFVGLAVGGVMITVIGPIYGLISNVSPN